MCVRKYMMKQTIQYMSTDFTSLIIVGQVNTNTSKWQLTL